MTFPTPRTEYLSLNHGGKSEWSENRVDAEFFEDYAKADSLAHKLRRFFTGCFIFAAIAQKPIPHPPVLDPAPREIKSEPKAIRIDRFRELQCRRDPVEAS